MISGYFFHSTCLRFMFMFRYYIGTHVFPDVLFNDIAGPDGDPLLLSLKLSVDILVSDGDLMCH